MKIKPLANKYDPVTVEKEVFEFWYKSEIYKKRKEKNKGKDKFYFLDGPPYVTNPIHVGTAWNKLIKDSYLRYFRLKGYDVWDIPGFDMHGLPIEVQVEQMLKLGTKKDIEKFGVDRFIKECRNYALRNLEIQANQFKELGVSMDWSNPYMTIKNEYIESVWFFIKRAHEKGLLFKGNQVVHWCPRCETVLAGYEVTEEYREKEDPSLYVKFKLLDEDAFLLVWTTTPWTLPSNVAVAVHPEETYVYAKTEEGELVILAKKRKEEVEVETKKKLEIIKEIKGKDLNGKKYTNPLEKFVEIQKRIEHKVILSEEFVSMLEGTGFVHIAPGHGIEDFNLGKIYGLIAISPVDASGKYTEEAGKYKGEYVFDANKEIIDDLKNLNALFFAGKIKHRYPHCWRCKTPLILRLSEQWFLNVPRIKEKLIEEARKINWYPEGSLEGRVIPWLSNVHEWALSRQRYWGIPMPIWICKNCGEIIVIGSLKELLTKALNLPSSEVDLHKPWIDEIEIKCDKCNGIAKRIPDVLDVWVDSGAASWSSLGYPSRNEEFEKLFPADLIIEGPDQIRGWFYSLLVTSVVTFDRAAMKNVLIHGWSLDETGRAMHKSLGNVINPEDVIPKFGRDSLRVYELSNTTWEDLRFSISKLQEYFKMLNIIWNTYYFCSLYMSLDNFDPAKFRDESCLEIEDLWLLNRIEEVKRKAEESFRKFESFEALKEIMNFLIEDVSRWYIRLVRKRVWIEMEDPSKEAAYYTLYKCLRDALIMLSPFAPFISEAIYQKFCREVEGVESVHLQSWPEVSKYDLEIIRKMNIIRDIVSKANSLRMKKGMKLRIPLKEAIIIPKNDYAKEAVKDFLKILKEQINVKNLKVLEDESFLEAIKINKAKINYEVAGPKLKGDLKLLSKYLESYDVKRLKEELETKGEATIEMEGKFLKIEKDMIIFTEELKEEYSSIESENAKIFLDFTLTEEIQAEALAKEIVRRIQMMRKLAELNITDKIKVYISTPGKEEEKLLQSMLDYIKNETQAIEIYFEEKTGIKGTLVREWDIDDEMFIIGIEKVFE